MKHELKRILFNERGSVGEEPAETLVTETSAEETEVRTEDALYSDDQKVEEPVEDDQDKTDDSETEVAESTEAEDQTEIEEPTDDKKEEQDYKLELSEGSLISEGMLGEIEAMAKETSLSKEAASKILDTQDKLLKGWVDAQLEAHETEVDGWRELVENDKELGGSNLERTVAQSHKTVELYAGEEFKALLKETGYGNHPEVVKFFSAIGKDLMGGQLVQGKESSSPKSHVEHFYGSN